MPNGNAGNSNNTHRWKVEQVDRPPQNVITYTEGTSCHSRNGWGGVLMPELVGGGRSYQKLITLPLFTSPPPAEPRGGASPHAIQSLRSLPSFN